MKLICLVCANKRSREFIKLKPFTIYTCLNCDAKFLRPLPTDKSLNEFYKEGYFHGKAGGVGGYKNYSSLKRNLEYEANAKLKYIRERVDKGYLLDVGAGSGIFAEEAQKKGFTVAANDISSFAKKEIA